MGGLVLSHQWLVILRSQTSELHIAVTQAAQNEVSLTILHQFLSEAKSEINVPIFLQK